MSVITAETETSQDLHDPDLVRTARTTGWLYLGLAITGLLGFIIIRSQIFVADDPAATLTNLTDSEWLARAGVLLEVGIVLTQTLTALWFFKLFRRVDSFAAGALAAFGLINAVLIMGSAAMLATALEVSGDPSLAASGDQAATVQLMYVVSGHLWAVGGLFFGLWLIPMGWLVVRSDWMPRALGWVLMVGGVGYMLGVVANYAIADAGIIANLAAMPASVGEFWMIGYLIIFGIRRPSAA